MCTSLLSIQTINLRYSPFLLKIIGVLNKLSLKTGIYIPTTPAIIELLQLEEFNKKGKANEEGIIEMELATKISKKCYNDIGFHNKLVKECQFHLLNFFQNNCNKVYFPELFEALHFSLQSLKKSLYVRL